MDLGFRLGLGPSVVASGDDLSDVAISYSGSDVDYTVGSGVDYLALNLGAGGGGAGAANFGSGIQYSGAGGYVEGVLPVSQGDVIRVQAAQGGVGGDPTGPHGGAGGWPDGGGGGRGDTFGGGGGGSSRVWKSTDGGSTWVLMAVAGAGGGGGGWNPAGNAGAGGGLEGQSATGNGGTGGTQDAVGVDANATGVANKQGVALSTSDPTPTRIGGWGSSTGDTTTSSSDDGGGGGGGYKGGGGGGGDGESGGGGSGYLHSSIVGGLLATGNVQTPPLAMTNSDAYPGTGESEGKIKSTTSKASDGGNGFIRVRSTLPIWAEAALVFENTTSTRLRVFNRGTWTAPSGAAEPVVTTSNGLDALFFEDGSFDRLESGVTPGDYTSAAVYVVFASVAATEAGFVMTDDASTKYLGRLLDGNTTPPLSSNAGTPAEYVDFVQVTTRDALHDALAVSAVKVYKATAVDFSSWSQIYVAGNGGAAGAYLESYVHEAAIIENPTAGQIATLDAYYGTFIA